ncbi:uncharacterized protein [Typha latifolia]|uniref:uncharacterized protein n=1 Tax=Typha latifolia TaxID=4733 RepID=UPI003C2D38E9
MYQRSRSKSREKPAMADRNIRRNPTDGEGSAHFRRRTSASDVPSNSSRHTSSSVEGNTFSLEFSRSISKKAIGLPMKMLIDEEVSKEVEIRHPSPSLVARLMGLDTLPPPPPRVHKQQSNVGNHLRSASSMGFQDKYVFSEDHSHKRSGDEHLEFKDVFEVMEAPDLTKHKSQKVRKGKLSSKNSKCDMDFIRQKFMDAKRLSADEAFQNSNELNDALEILDMNKDLFLEFLQEPNSLLSRHLQDLNGSPPSPHGRHIRRSRSSRDRKCDRTEICLKSERRSLNCDAVSKDFRKSSTKPAASLISHSVKEHSGSLPHRSVRSHNEGETGSCMHPTKIVILKPSLEKMAGAIPLGQEMAHIHYRRTAESPESQNQGILQEGNVQPKLSDSLETLRPKIKGSRELAREITQQMRQTINCGTRKVLNVNIANEGSCTSSYMVSRSNPEALQGSSDLCDDWSNIFSPSSMHSTGSSVSKEARERLCERWKMTNRFREEGLVLKGSSTLGEMLALSDMESPKAAPRPRIYQKASNEKSPRDQLLRACVPLGISSKDGWKDGSSSNLPRSKSVPAPSTIRGSPRSRRKRSVQSNDFSMLKDVLNMETHDSIDERFSRRGRSVIRSPMCYRDKDHLAKSFGEENMLPEREIHVNSEELKDSVHVTDLAELRPIHAAIPGDAVTARNHIIDSSVVLECRDAKQTSLTQKQMASAILVKDEDIVVHNQDDMAIEEEQIDNPQAETIPSPSCGTDSVSPVSSKEGERPSPVSVLEPPSEEENSSSGCFEGISADLQELRMQLRLLKQESTDTCAEETELFILSDEDNEEDVRSLPPMGEILPAFRDEEDRDFSYLLDMLIDLGVPGANQDVLFDACYSQECPVSPEVFDKLEKKYCKLFLWSRSDRKLLFDLINSTLVDFMASCMDLQPCMMPKRWQPKWQREDFVEEVWQMVVKRRRELRCSLEGVLEVKWSDLRCCIDTIGIEIEEILHDDLLEELVLDLIFR